MLRTLRLSIILAALVAATTAAAEDPPDFLFKFGDFGTGNGLFLTPFSVVVDQANFVYVADLEVNRIQKFTDRGVYVSQWGTIGTGNGRGEVAVAEHPDPEPGKRRGARGDQGRRHQRRRHPPAQGRSIRLRRAPRRHPGARAGRRGGGARGGRRALQGGRPRDGDRRGWRPGGARDGPRTRADARPGRRSTGPRPAARRRSS